MRQHLKQLADIDASWQRFRLGLSFFAVGAAALLLLGEYHVILYWLSMAVLLIGFTIAMSGYAGIFWHRIRGINPSRRKSPPSGD